jgi:glycosyltransferase involved in cell wall biosynthesis
LPEVVGDAGLLFDPMDVEAIAWAIQQITSDPQLRMNLKQRGFDRAKQFTWQRAADQTIEVYKEVIFQSH